MIERWQDKRGLVHLLDEEAIPDSTWCHHTLGCRLADLIYVDKTDLPPTCIMCIANTDRYYNLPNIRRLRGQR